MNRIVITDAYFPSDEAEKWRTRLQAKLINLDNLNTAVLETTEPLFTSEENVGDLDTSL
jgi:L-fucose mutarotase/ribose pyranase (RbsD/FucU family)